MFFRALSLLAITAGLAVTATAADWAQWRGQGRDGKSADTGLLQAWPKDGPKLLWTVQDVAKVGTGYGSPAVVGDRVYVHGGTTATNAKEFCTCLSTKDGSVVWKTTLETTEAQFKESWGSGPRDTPTVDGESLYVLGTAGDLYCLRTADGKTAWHKNLVRDFGGKVPEWGYSESVLIDGDKLICAPGGGKAPIVALNKKTGETVWKCEAPFDSSYSSAVVAEVGGVRQYVQQLMKDSRGGRKGTGGATVGVRASDGKLLWKVEDNSYMIAVIPTPVVAGDRVFVTSGYSAGCKLIKLAPDSNGGTTAEKVYASKNVTNHHGGVVLVGNHIYGHSDSSGGNWVCVDLATGDEVWTATNLKVKGSVTYADGMLYCYSEAGTLALVKATTDGWSETGRFDIPKTSPIRSKTQGKVWPHPVVANGRLYLRDYEYLYCYDIVQPSK